MEEMIKIKKSRKYNYCKRCKNPIVNRFKNAIYCKVCAKIVTLENAKRGNRKYRKKPKEMKRND